MKLAHSAQFDLLEGTSGFIEFAAIIGMSEEEKHIRKALLDQSFMPFKVTRFYTYLIASQKNPIYREQLINIILPPTGDKPFVGRFDPYGNKTYRRDGQYFIQHKYTPTLLFHIDDFCISNCQFCYKVNEIRLEKINQESIANKMNLVLKYLDAHPEINNVLFTGGDPAAFRNTKDLIKIIKLLITHKNIRLVRFATKGLVYYPQRFMESELINFLYEINAHYGKQVSVIAQINHPGEMGEECMQALHMLQQAQVQVRGQPALIRGVNDTVETLIDLQQKYLDTKVISYYLTIFMPVRGVEQYAITLHDAFSLVAQAKKTLNGFEKKGVLLTSHDFGKFEVCGFLPSINNPQKIVLKWHQAAMPKYLPQELKGKIPTQTEDLLLLDYHPQIYCIDHLFAANGLPYINSKGILSF